MRKERDVLGLHEWACPAERRQGLVPFADAECDGHVGGLAGRRRPRVVEIQMAVDVGEADRSRVTASERRGDRGHHRAAPAQHDREGGVLEHRPQALVHAAPGLEQGGIPDDAVRRIATADDAHGEVACILGLDLVEQPEVTQDVRRELRPRRRVGGAEAATVGVDGHADDDARPIEHRHAAPSRAIVPAPTTASPSYSAAVCPGATPNAGRSRWSSTPSGVCATRAGTAGER